MWGFFVLSNLGIYKNFCGVARIYSFVSYFKISREIELCAGTSDCALVLEEKVGVYNVEACYSGVVFFI